jgi:hypothetical protein
MTFEAMVTAKKVRAATPKGVTFAVYGRTDVTSGSAEIMVGSEVLAQLCWSPSDKFEVCEGTGPDHGFTMIRRVYDDSSRLKLTGWTKTGNAAIRINGSSFVRHALLPLSFHQTPVEFQAFNGALTIMMPL